MRNTILSYLSIVSNKGNHHDTSISLYRFLQKVPIQQDNSSKK